MDENVAEHSGGELDGPAGVRAGGYRRARLRLVPVDGVTDPGERVGGALFAAARALGELSSVDLSTLTPAEFRVLMEGTEELRRSVESTSVRLAGYLEEAQPFADQGSLSAKATLKHMCKLSGPEAHRRLQTARLHRGSPDWERAESAGRVGVAQSELMAQVAANRHIGADALERASGDLLDDAISVSFDEFEARLRTWEGEADPDGDRERNEEQKTECDFKVRPSRGGGWTITGRLGELEGAGFNEVFAHYVDAEWKADWADVRERLGDTATTGDLRRTEPERRAAAAVKMANDAAATPPGAQRPATTVNVLIDQQTFEDRLTGAPTDPQRYHDIVCRTQAGRRVHPDDVINASLIDHVRRVVYDASGTVIDLGRRSRLFRGASREAVMLLNTHCVWVGCDRPVAWCQADHSTSWKAHGASVPRNGSPLCGTHNRLKERGFEVYRDEHGDWRTIDPDGSEIS